jgi:hypothetical protein
VFFAFRRDGADALLGGMPAPAPKKENLILNLVCNIAVPTLVLTKLSEEKYLGPQWGIVVALIFPLSYGIYDLVTRKKANLFSIIGVVSVLLTGILNQLKADVFWFAVKEAAMPTLLGIALLISMKTKRPLVRELLWNDAVIDTAKVEGALAARGHTAEFDRRMERANYGMAASFLLSAVLNYGLARYLLKDPPGTTAFNEQLGRMNLLSWPVIVLPTTVVTIWVFWKLMSALTHLSGLTLDEALHSPPPKPEKK